MRILVIHNQLWAHYKSVLFEEIHQEIRSEHPISEFLVAQIALYESSRAGMGNATEQIPYKYPYVVLFNKSLDSVTFFERTRSIFKAFNSFKPDVLNITGYFDWAQVLLLFYARLCGVKVVLSSESSQVDKTRSFLKETIKKIIVHRANAFFCFGNTSVSYLKSLGISDQKIAVRKAAVVDNERIKKRYLSVKAQEKSDCETHYFVFVGRLAPEKNLLILLKAYQTFLNQIGNTVPWGLLFVGDGPDRKPMEDFAKANSLSKVKFTGAVGWQEVPEWLAKADVLILPSHSEPWGLVVNEAMICGMPVLVSKNCGCAEDLVQHGQNGFLFDPADQQALVQAMLFYQKYPEKIESHGLQSMDIIAGFSPEKVAKEMVACYHSLS
ncbi:glycosyltransferase family 4 protein [Arundinibacter roseus]|uniref:Glycosyltransferase family 1 protein n=1 Tax=Arundinibacter roseus TaxID=2070510 RepID=A0A4R4KCU1_9BACT|nr:glycosyltransferase family 4 protein [Arundinibacter roseus]TDB64672.1 glycosyltransferase family 1 protein [Arundinibacter roseus]